MMGRKEWRGRWVRGVVVITTLGQGVGTTVAAVDKKRALFLVWPNEAV